MPLEFRVDTSDAGIRLDVFLAQQFPELSRVQLQRAVQTDDVLLDGRPAKSSYKLRGGELITVTPPQPLTDVPQGEDIPLSILFEDDALVVVDKPPGMVVHPAKGHWSGTLTAALAFHFEQLSSVGGATRPGIVHRLDRDTSGVIVIAKTDQAHLALAAQFEARTVQKEYFAVTAGVPDRDRDVVDLPIGPHPHQRDKMAIRPDHPASRPARTFYEVAERFRGFAVVRAFPKTGRTHQIRLHLAHIGCPVLCDRLYSGRASLSRGSLTTGREDADILLDRQALHAHRITFQHPLRSEPLSFEAPLPDDIQTTLTALRTLRT